MIIEFSFIYKLNTNLRLNFSHERECDEDFKRRSNILEGLEEE